MEEHFLLHQMRTFFSLKCGWNGPIRLHSNRHWSFSSTKDNRYELYRVHPKKLWPSPFRLTLWLLYLCLLQSWFIRWSPLFWFLRFGCEVMDPCFVHSNELTQKFIWITLKHLQTLFWNRHTVALMVHSEQTQCPSCFFNPIVRAKLKSLYHVICLWSRQSRALSLVDQSKQYRGLYRWFLAAWFHNNLNWTSRTRYITCGCMTTFKFIHPIVYSRKRWCRRMCYEHYPTWLWFLSALNLSYVDVWLLHETHFFAIKVVRFNRLQKWNYTMNSAQNLTVISWEMLLVKK